MAKAKITNKLLKDAIADAEAVRETAVANAKLVLEEAITPQIRDMIARRLRVEADMINEPEAEELEKAKDESFEEAEPVGGEGPEDTSTIGTGDNKEPSADSFDTSDIDSGGEAPADSATDWYDDWSESDFDLDEVIKELEEDIAALTAKDDVDGEEGEEGEGHEALESPEEEEKEEMKETETAPDVNKFAKPNGPVFDEAEPEEAPAGEVPPGLEKPEAPVGDEEEELDLEAILAELEAEEGEEGGEEELGNDPRHAAGTIKAMATELARLKGQMAQYKEAVSTLRGHINEVNLLNSKLLFTNKIFRKEGLSNEQKVRIVESFDRATTVREVKLVYAALVENLSVVARSFNASRKKVVTEGFASKTTRSTAPKSEMIVENAVATRLKELAGII